MAQNVLDFSLEYFAPANEPELYTAVSNAGESELERFLEEYRAFATLSPSSIRPYIPYSFQPGWTVGGLQLDSDTLKDDGAEWKIADAVKHRLLYCHSIALDDPLGDLLALTTAQMRSNQGDSAKRALLRFVNLSLHFGALIRSHILCLLPNRSYSADSQKRFRRRDDLAQALNRLGNYDPREYIEAAAEEQQLVDEIILTQVATDLALHELPLALRLCFTRLTRCRSTYPSERTSNCSRVILG